MFFICDKLLTEVSSKMNLLAIRKKEKKKEILVIFRSLFSIVFIQIIFQTVNSY